MARFDDAPDVELSGRVTGGSGKAFLFEPDYGAEEEIWIPKSQATWVPDPDSDDKRGTMFVKAWLADKNGWTA